MYTFVENKAALGAVKSFGNELMWALISKLTKKGIQATCFLIGSGAKNLVTQNGEKPFDLDYNLKVSSCPVALDDLKDEIRFSFNEVLDSCGLPNCSDSTSSLTTAIFHLSSNPEIRFSLDVGVISENKNGQLQRLIHDKKVPWRRFLWVIAPDSEAVDEKVDAIKSAGYWDCVREDYLRRKNHYLSKNDHEHPSFICYIETINDVYNWMNQ